MTVRKCLRRVNRKRGKLGVNWGGKLGTDHLFLLLVEFPLKLTIYVGKGGLSPIPFCPIPFIHVSPIHALAFQRRLNYYYATFVAIRFGVKPWECQYA